MAMFESSGYLAFDRLRDLARATRELLHAVVRGEELPSGAADVLAGQTLPHLETVQAGFRGWLRAEGVTVAELRYLLAQLAELRVTPASTDAERRAAAAEALAEARLRAGTGSPRAADGAPAPVTPSLHVAEAWDLAALAHARLVFAMLPRLEPIDVHWPAGRPTYADIPTPRGPAELAARLAEIERQLWQTATGRAPAAHDPALRRTYGFFDTAEWLGRQGLGQVA